jgi:transposase
MARSYRPVLREQAFLLPPDMRQWLPGDHLVWFVLEIVGQLDCSRLHARRVRGGAGRAAYDPQMLLGLLVYGYCLGVRSSRQIERLCGTDVAFRVLCAQDVPDHTTIARFRAEHQAVFEDLFAQVLLVAAKAGLGRFGTVAIDGTKILANAAVDANRDSDWLERRLAEQVAGQVEVMVSEAAGVDAAEDAQEAAQADGDGDGGGGGGGGSGVASALRDPTRRAQRIAAAAAEVRAVARARAEAQAQAAAKARAAASRRAREEARRERRAQQRLAEARAGQLPRGRLLLGPHRLAEAQAHLDTAIAAQQAKLDRWDARVAATGKRPRGPRPLPPERSRDVIRARAALQRAAEAALAARMEHDQATNDQATNDQATNDQATNDQATNDQATNDQATNDQATAKAAESSSTSSDSADSSDRGPVANVTDPQSRLMPTRRGFVQGYNAQVAVTADQLIVAMQLSQQPGDVTCFVSMMQAAQAAAQRLQQATGSQEHVIGTLLADAGYASDANLTEPGPDRLIALGKRRDQTAAARSHPASGPPPPDATPRQAMDHRLRTDDGARLYKRRGATVEPGIGNLKKLLDRFSRRGLQAAASELHLAGTAFNLLKIYRASLT